MKDICAKLLLVSASVFICTPAQATVYKYIDENGQVAYGDKPVEGAKQLKLRGRPTRDTDDQGGDDATATNDPDDAGRMKKQPVIKYQSLEILTPKNNKTVHGSTGNVEVVMLATPKLQNDHSLVITLDGKEIANGRHANLSLTEVPRGAHKLMARITDKKGVTLVQAPTVTFHVKRPVIDEESPLAFDRNQ